MPDPATQQRRPRNESTRFPRVIFGTSCLGNLYAIVPEVTKLAIVSEILMHGSPRVVFDCAGKYGAGLALESLGRSLRKLGVQSDAVEISNKLGWYRIPLREAEPTFERGVWRGIHHDAELRISYDGILECYQQGLELLGQPYSTQLVSVHDPDEYLAAAESADDRRRRFENIVSAYGALYELKAKGAVKSVGIGAKSWRVIREIAAHIDLDWVMLACSLTVYSHPAELLDFIAELRARNVRIINSAVFNSGFLTGGSWFNYRAVDPIADAGLLRWRQQFLSCCRTFGVTPADACVQFGLSVPGVTAVALNTENPDRIKANVATGVAQVPPALWEKLQAEGLIASYFPLPT